MKEDIPVVLEILISTPAAVVGFWTHFNTTALPF